MTMKAKCENGCQREWEVIVHTGGRGKKLCNVCFAREHRDYQIPKKDGR